MKPSFIFFSLFNYKQSLKYNAPCADILGEKDLTRERNMKKLKDKVG